MQKKLGARSATLRLVVAPLVVAGLAGELAAQAARDVEVTTRPSGIDLANFDASVRPQDDFYRHVNGAWLDRTEIPADQSAYGTFIELRDRSEAALHALLEEATATANPAAGSELQKLGDYYGSFMDSARIESLGVEPLRAELRLIESLRRANELPRYFAYLARLGVQTPFSLSVSQDARQADRYIAYLSQSGLGLPDRDYYFQEGESFERTRVAYAEYVATLLRLAGERDAEGAARAVLALETRLAEHHWDRARNRDREATYNLKSFEELRSLAPAFDWTGFLRAVGGERSPGVVVRQPDYFEALGQIIRETPVGTWRQYLSFKLLDTYADVLSSDFANARFEFRGRVLAGIDEQRPRWKRAVSATESALGEAAGKLYVERHFPPEARARMQELVDNLMEAFRLGIDELEWMGPDTKAEAQAKLAQFNMKIGYPDRWRDYSALEVRAGNAAGNLMRANQFAFQRTLGRLGRPIDRKEWWMTPQTVNAYYSSTMNEIVFPAAILQPPFFDLEADDAANYGAIGAVIGHEISHGFDDQGSRSDGSGNLRNWWTEEDLAAFRERTGRLVEQYGRYCPIDGLCVDGRVALGENIADLSGLAVAYRAYQLSLGDEPAPVIDGLTGDQRFFMGWAQIWRMNYRDEALRQRVMVGPHSPNMYRVNGVVVNMPEFYAAFEVSPGDEMYLPPEERVKIW